MSANLIYIALDTCTGDSGVSLVVQNKDKSYFLAGITSWGFNCKKNTFQYSIHLRHMWSNLNNKCCIV